MKNKAAISEEALNSPGEGLILSGFQKGNVTVWWTYCGGQGLEKRERERLIELPHNHLRLLGYLVPGTQAELPPEQKYVPR